MVVVEGVMPYNTNEGQIVIDLSTNQENLDFIEIQNCEPVEYSDKYVPSKYGIIFKEKIVVQPQEHTAVSLNIRLMKGGVDFQDLGLLKYYTFTIYDNGLPFYIKKGYNQINLSHFLFRSNAGLPDGPS